MIFSIQSIVPKYLPGEFTYSNAIREIVRINAEFNPAFIYADRGHGEYQIEALHKYGEMHPETGLDKKVRGISFSDRIRIPDPVTKEIDNKDIKPFMVNQAVLLLENGRLALPTNDRLIMDQMLDYYEERRTPTGRPVYSSENDHALDAFMLSLLAFTLEFTDIAKSKLTSQIAPAPKLDFAYDYTHQKKKQKKAFTGAAFVDSGTMRGFGTRSSLRQAPKENHILTPQCCATHKIAGQSAGSIPSSPSLHRGSFSYPLFRAPVLLYLRCRS